MNQNSDIATDHTPPTTVIDFEAAAQRITTDRIAAVLLNLASEESVRTIEALASTLVNCLRSERDIDQPFACERIKLLRYPSTMSGTCDARTEAFRRIARRALRGTLIDPTRGATAFHRIEQTPNWSKETLPIAVFGSFLFYRI